MTRDKLVAFAEASARNDAKRGRVSSAQELQDGFAGYTACLALFGYAKSASIRTDSASVAIDAYKTTRGLLYIAAMPTTSQRVRRIARSRRAVAKSVPWSGSLLKARRQRKAA